MSLASCRCSIPVFLLEEMGGERFTDCDPTEEKSPEGHPGAERIGRSESRVTVAAISPFVPMITAVMYATSPCDSHPMSIERVGNAKLAFRTVTRKVPGLWVSTAETRPRFALGRGPRRIVYFRPLASSCVVAELRTLNTSVGTRLRLMEAATSHRSRPDCASRRFKISSRSS